ncbi:hypothetical protein [Chlorobium sp. N1]|uniref:TPM domain-containing protein n=1 Tax=Chlorobium sp. N1 TaxID=2491138 RepID=UPI00103EDD7C|nr:hypothetical protein [Chlorobium sp. N1]TCD47568.1 hypothetical protein E0L29_06865 [Chlorobium sp. N1]
MANDPVTRLLGEAGRRKVEESIRAAETRTSGEIVVMVVESSARYRHQAMVGALLSSMALSVASAHFLGGDGMWAFLSLFVPLFVAFHELLVRMPSLRRLLARKAEMEEAVGRASLAAFYEKGITGTEGRTGVLIYISLFERMVRVVADRGINDKVDEGAWTGVVEGIVRGIRGADAAGALSAAVEQCGRLLESHFPIQSGDRNELSDRIRS